MLTIRMKRTGRKGHPQYRLVVQDSRFSPTSGRVVSFVGSYNPHNKQTVIDKEKVEKYLSNGAKPSDRVARMLQAEGVRLPDWVKLTSEKQRSIKSPEKLRKNRPADEPVAEAENAEEQPEAPTESANEENAAPDVEAENSAAEDANADEPAA